MLQFPIDATTRHYEFTGNVVDQLLLPAAPRTFLHFNYASDPIKSTQVWFYCGTPSEANEILETHGNELVLFPFQYYCDQNIYYTLTGYGGQGAHLVITTVPRNVASSTEYMTVNIANDRGATTSPIVINGFSQGEILIAYMFFIILVASITRGIIKLVYGNG